MKLLLLQPPVQDFYDTEIRLQPIGLCYLKAAVRKHLPDWQVVVKDYHQGWGRHTMAIPKELTYLKAFYPCADYSPFSSFYHYYHYGATFAEIAEDVMQQQPDIVGISSLFSPYYREVCATATHIKQRKNIPIIVGGAHVSALPESMLQHPDIDFIIRGEGERPLVEFLKAQYSNNSLSAVPNLGFKQNGEIVLNTLQANYPIEEIPPPDFSDLPLKNYMLKRRPLAMVITSRGCPHRCRFCSVRQTFRNCYQRRSANNIIAEIEQRYRKGYRVFDFEDDNLTLAMDEAKQLCKLLIAKFPQNALKLVAMNGISYISLDSELLQLMKQAGFSHVNLSLVTANAEIQRHNQRPHALEKYLYVVEQAHRIGLQIVSYQILGLPRETLDSMIETLAINARLPVLLGASVFYLTPSSPISQNFPPPTATDIFKARLTAMAMETEHVCRQDIYTLFITTRIINFLKGISFKDARVELVTALELATRQSKRSAIGAQLFTRLLKEKKLFAINKNGLQPLTQFDSELFFAIYTRLGHIVTQQNNKIIL